MQTIRLYSRYLFIWGLWIFAFFIPYSPAFLVPIELCFLIGFFLSQKPSEVFGRLRKITYAWISIAYFLSIVISILAFPGPPEEAFRQLMLKLPFLLIPLVVLGSDLSVEEVKYALKAFALGCLSSGILQLLDSFKDYMMTGEITYFSHYEFANFMHITYLGVYQMFASSFLLYIGLRTPVKWKKAAYLSASILCVLFVFLSSAKIMIVALTALSFVMLALIIRNERKGAIWWSLPILILCLPLVFYKISDKFKMRIDFAIEELVLFYNQEDEGRAYSTGQRLLLWRNAETLVKHNFLMGVGVSNVQNSVDFVMEDSGDASRIPVKLNLHNEYLQSWAGLGIVGLLLVCALFMSPLYYKDSDRIFITLTFVIAIGIAALTESVLERQAGVLFTSLIGCLLVAWSQIAKNENKEV